MDTGSGCAEMVAPSASVMPGQDLPRQFSSTTRDRNGRGDKE